MRALSAAVMAVALAVSGGQAGIGPVPADPGTVRAAAEPAEPAVASYVCGKPALRALNAVCGRLFVPLDYARPDGPKVALGFTILRATSPLDERQGMLVINPGGPGSPGLMQAERLNRLLPKDVSRRYDIVGLDPRGIGTSEPRMSCDPHFGQGPRPSYIPTSGVGGAVSAPEKAWLARSAAYGAACKAKYPGVVEHMTSLDTVRDLDQLREGLHTPYLSFYGLSYGTYLAQLYATRYPTHTHRMVLDGVMDARKVWKGWLDERPAHMERSITSFFGWTARHDKAYGIGDTTAKVRARYFTELRRLLKAPVGHLGSAEWQDAFLVAAYSRAGWKAVAEAFSAWVRHDLAPMTTLWSGQSGEGNDNFRAVYLSVLCSDAPWPRDYKVLRKKAFAIARTAPFDAWHTLWATPAACMTWPAPAHKPPTIDGTKAPPVLLVSSTLDPATPYSGALETRRRFPRSRLVAEDGNPQHGVSLRGNRCIDRYVAQYLKTGRLPTRRSGAKADAHCKRLPDPEP